MPSTNCHSSPFAGSWYPGDRNALEDLLAECWEKSENVSTGPVLPGPLGFVVPHAGIAYSGPVAAAAYRALAEQRPRRVFILGFRHRGSPPGAWIPDITAYKTPLGETLLDSDAARALLASGVVRKMPEDQLCDHSVEIQLPPLSRAVPEATIVPIYVSALDAAERKRVAAELAAFAQPGTVFLASSDFTHYGDAFHYKPFPSDSGLWGRLRLLDYEYIDAASSLDSDLFLRTLDARTATLCGREPIALLMDVLHGLPSAKDIFQVTLDYATSGEMTRDRTHSVSYAALGYYPWQSFLLDASDGECLLECARENIWTFQQTGARNPVGPRGGSPALDRPAAAFVTLRKAGELRGCVGRSSSSEPLSQVVPDVAISAASEDRRFEPLGRDEKDIEVSVSVLSPMKRLARPVDLRVGCDGAFLQSSAGSGLLLPEVAEGRDWTPTQFLDLLARKAGVNSAVYDQPDTLLHTFRTQVFH